MVKKLILLLFLFCNLFAYSKDISENPDNPPTIILKPTDTPQRPQPLPINKSPVHTQKVACSSTSDILKDYAHWK